MFFETKRDDLLDDPNTAYLDLDSAKYKAEQDLADRYKSYVAEILRVSLAAVAVIGFLYKVIFENGSNLLIPKWFAIGGVIAFALSTVFALLFMYFYAEGLRWYIVGLRYFTNKMLDKAKIELSYRKDRLKFCRFGKGLAAILLAIGGILTAISIIITIIN